VKLVTFADPDGRMRCGALDNSHVRTIDGVATMLELFESGEDVGTVGAGANGERRRAAFAFHYSLLYLALLFAAAAVDASI